MDKKLYCFFVGDIHGVGGVEMYLSNMYAKLRRLGWDVRLLHSGLNFGKCDIPVLDEFISCGNRIFAGYKPSSFSDDELDYLYRNVYEEWEIALEDYEKIIIESDNSYMDLWGEFFSERMGARHICMALSESYDYPGSCYYEELDFYYFKFYRNELYGGVWKLFGDRIDIREREQYKAWDLEENPIKDTVDSLIDCIDTNFDYTITYIGRTNKIYVPNIIHEIRRFAQGRDKRIQFIIVGDYEGITDIICRELCTVSNVKVMLLGSRIPIPKILFDKTDVVIANSQTAFFSSFEDKPVIVIDGGDRRAVGVLGVDCTYDECVFAKKGHATRELSVVLEELLVKGTYSNALIKKPSLSIDNSMKIWNRMLTLVERNSKEYYKTKSGKAVKRDFNRYNGISINSGVNTDLKKLSEDGFVLFGAGIIGKECLKWARKNGLLCKGVADNNCNRWGEYYEGLVIESPEDILDDNCFVIISNYMYKTEILEQVIKYGVSESCCQTYDALKEWSFVEFLRRFKPA